MATINLATKEIGGAIKNAAYNFKECLGKGVRAALWAIALFPIPSAGLCQPSPSLLRGALTTEAAIVGLQGSERIGKGESAIEVLKGSLQTASGVAGAVLLSHLDERILAAAHQASLIVLPSAFLMKAGLYELKKGHYGPGLSKVLVGTGGILSAAYAVYSTYQDQTDDPHERQEFLTEDRKAFLEAHKEEINKIYEKKSPVGEWTQLGEGMSKKAFTHPARDDMIIKIPAMDTIGFHAETPEGDLIQDFINREKLRPIAARYDQILLPSQTLYPTSKGIMIVEQKIEGIDFSDIEDSPGTERALAQFDAFRIRTGLCDILPESNLNARFLSLGNFSTPTIAIYDTDCLFQNRKKKLNFQNLGELFFHPSFQSESLFLVRAAVIAAAATTIAKRIDKTAPARVLRTVITCGVVSACAAYFDEPLFQPSATILGASLGIVVGAIGAVPFLAREKIKSCAKNCLARALPTWHFT